MVFPHRPLIVFLLLLGAAATAPLEAQLRLPRQEPRPEERFLGHWTIQTEGGQKIYINVKRNNRASFFYGLIRDNTVYQGRWSVFGDALFLEWEKGHTDVMRPFDAQNFRFAQFKSGYTGSETPDDEGIARQIPRNEVGMWAIPPGELESRSAAQEEVEGFFGIWEIRDPTGFTYYVMVNDDRTAASSYPRSRKGRTGLRGEWRRQGAELHIMWDTGHYQIIRERPQDYVSELRPPTTNLDEEIVPIQVQRVNEVSATAWLDIYESEEIFIRANPFRTRGDVNSFFRGKWVLLDEGEPVQEIDVGRFGGLGIRGSRLGGTWRASTDAIYLYWEDGHRAILSPRYLNFTYQIFTPGQPFDGTPTRIYEAVPGDPAKLAQFRDMKMEASMRLRAYREIQEEIRQQPIPVDDDGPRRDPWWRINIWPFGRDS